MLQILSMIALIVTQTEAVGISPTALEPSAETLPALLDTILNDPEVADAQISLHVVRVSDGQVLYAKNENELRVPASTIKLFTTAAALDELGPDYRFKTEIYGPTASAGIVPGDIHLKGYGDPWLVPERFWYFANRLKYAGITQIDGDIIVDESYFDGPAIAAGHEQDTSSSAYMAPAGALSVGFNAVLVHILPTTAGQPARIAIEPESDYVTVKGSVTTSERTRTRVSVEVVEKNGQSVVEVGGYILQTDNPRGYWRRIQHPGLHSGAVFKAILKSIGIKVQGSVRLGVLPVPAVAAPAPNETAAPSGEAAPPEPMIAMTSPRLADLMEKVNKYSNNFMAGQLARALGAETLGAPGSWEKGEQAIQKFLKERVQISAPLPVIKNASGLHDVNHVTSKHVTELLCFMAREPKHEIEFLNSMAVAGGVGTLKSRMQEGSAHQILRAKTGTLSIASALSGYVTTQSGELLAFSVLVNHFQHGIQPVWKMQDAIGETLSKITDSPKKHARLKQKD
jgi:D-alanyl-D-alanine carboxypeptidase/D-alanyl-D-alanine-endopeptidase (penicillin-binding protein 4)